ncbi:MAG: NADPH-dependent F420 reductase [Aigarchaeota archaeon]|nr:NADPH-dependent F420 reductase [Candidatus Pelearchaeum maunauluense]
MRVAVLGGTGGLGFGLAARLALAGVEVVVGSRARERAENAASEISRLVSGKAAIRGLENSEAVRGCDIAMLTVPFEGIDTIIESILPNLNSNTIVVSCIVPLKADLRGYGSAAELVRDKIPGQTPVVAGFHTVSAEKLTKLSEPVGCDTIILGDDREAKKRVAELAYKIDGLRPVDGGALKNTRIVEQITQLLIGINRRYRIHDAAIKIVGVDDARVFEAWR